LLVCWRMKQFLYANNESSRQAARETLAKEWGGVSSSPPASNPGIDSYFSTPWETWYGDWEKRADSFGQR
jgi:hypothetical protein